MGFGLAATCSDGWAKRQPAKSRRLAALEGRGKGGSALWRSRGAIRAKSSLSAALGSAAATAAGAATGLIATEFADALAEDVLQRLCARMRNVESIFLPEDAA